MSRRSAVAAELLDTSLGIFEVAPLDRIVLHQALGGRGPDLEDSVIGVAHDHVEVVSL